MQGRYQNRNHPLTPSIVPFGTKDVLGTSSFKVQNLLTMFTINLTQPVILLIQTSLLTNDQLRLAVQRNADPNDSNA
jgi:hypothetical protein